jgi:hypothetical protein
VISLGHGLGKEREKTSLGKEREKTSLGKEREKNKPLVPRISDCSTLLININFGGGFGGGGLLWGEFGGIEREAYT